MRPVNILLFLTFITSLSHAQDWADVRKDLLSKLAQYRSDLLLDRREDILRLSDLLKRWEDIEPDEELRLDLLGDIQSSYTYRYRNLEKLIKRFLKYNPSSAILPTTSVSDVECIYKCHELVDLIKMGIVDDEFPFKLLANNELFAELEFYNLANGQAIGEVGAGNGAFAMILGLLNIDLSIYVNEIWFFETEAIKSRLSENAHRIDTARFKVTLGRKKRTNFPENHFDRIIMRKAFHHFKKKEAMLKSIRESLKKDGEVLVYESLKNKVGENFADLCPKLMTGENIIAHFEQAGFQLENYLSISNMTYVYRFKVGLQDQE